MILDQDAFRRKFNSVKISKIIEKEYENLLTSVADVDGVFKIVVNVTEITQTIIPGLLFVIVYSL